MAADLYIHVRTPNLSDEDFACFFSNSIGSKWFNLDTVCLEVKEKEKILDRYIQLIYRKYPEVKNLAPINYTPDAKKLWNKLYSRYLMSNPHYCSHQRKIDSTPSIHIGEVSWLKAALFEDSDTFVPSSVMEISEIIGEDFPIIDDELISRIASALKLENTTSYYINTDSSIIEFLKSYKGYPVFTISW